MRCFAVLIALIALGVAGPTFAGAVGFETITVPDGDDRPLEVGVWHPTETPPSAQRLGLFVQEVAPSAPVAGAALPLVVMSHGTGGWYGGHYDTALALARAGFVVAAVTHTGDNFRDESRATRILERPRHLVRVIEHMLGQWRAQDRLNPARIGAFGFSAGGYTVLAAAGGISDLAKMRAHCEAHPAFFDCGRLREGSASGPASSSIPGPLQSARIKAAVVAAPALGFTFAPDGLKAVAVPVQLWRAADDEILPSPFYAEPVRDALPSAPEYHEVAGAGHFDFLAPCSPAMASAAPVICRERAGFDRASFHEDFNRDVVAFFQRHLGL
jgi:predicted dienelactone hydrolase